MEITALLPLGSRASKKTRGNGYRYHCIREGDKRVETCIDYLLDYSVKYDLANRN